MFASHPMSIDLSLGVQKYLWSVASARLDGAAKLITFLACIKASPG